MNEPSSNLSVTITIEHDESVADMTAAGVRSTWFQCVVASADRVRVYEFDIDAEPTFRSQSEREILEAIRMADDDAFALIMEAHRSGGTVMLTGNTVSHAALAAVDGAE